MAGSTAVFLLVLHTGASIMFAAIVGESRRQLDNLAFLIIMSAQAYIANPFATGLLAVAFACQLRWTNVRRKAGEVRASALSKYTLASQSAIFLALAILWPSRLMLPSKLRREEPWYLIDEWYPFVGWACVNSFVTAAGNYVVLYVVSATDTKSTTGLAVERSTLLHLST